MNNLYNKKKCTKNISFSFIPLHFFHNEKMVEYSLIPILFLLSFAISFCFSAPLEGTNSPKIANLEEPSQQGGNLKEEYFINQLPKKVFFPPIGQYYRPLLKMDLANQIGWLQPHLANNNSLSRDHFHFPHPPPKFPHQFPVQILARNLSNSFAILPNNLHKMDNFPSNNNNRYIILIKNNNYYFILFRPFQMDNSIRDLSLGLEGIISN